MKAILELEQLGYRFICDGSGVYYSCRGEKPDPERTRPLLDKVRHQRSAAISFLQERASLEARERAFIESEAVALLERMDTMNELEWCRRWADVMTRLGAPCTSHRSWTDWLAEIEAGAEESTSVKRLSAIL